MEFTGRIIEALEPRSGMSARTGNPWKMQDFVIEETVGQFPKRMVFNVFGEDNLNRFNIQKGQELTVSFDINAREYNGRWYNDLQIWRIAPAGQPTAAPAAAPAPQVNAAPAPAFEQAPAPTLDDMPGDSPEEDLPF